MTKVLNIFLIGLAVAMMLASGNGQDCLPEGSTCSGTSVPCCAGTSCSSGWRIWWTCDKDYSSSSPYREGVPGYNRDKPKWQRQ